MSNERRSSANREPYPMTRILDPKKGRRRRRTPWIAIASALIVVFLFGGYLRAKEASAMRWPEERVGVPAYAKRGPFEVGTREVIIAGPTRLAASVWYPAESSGEAPRRIVYRYELKWFVRLGWAVRVAGEAVRNAPFDASAGARPLVVLSPGFSMGRTGYAWLAERLASHGFVVVAPEHRELMDAGMQGFWKALVTRPDDVRAVIDYVERASASGGDLAGMVDTEHVAVVGHSQGGYTALAAAGARLDLAAFDELCDRDREAGGANAWLCDMVTPYAAEMAARAGLEAVPASLWPSWGDPRVDAIVPMASDAFLFGPEGLAEVTVPVLALGGTGDPSAPFAWSTQLISEHASSEVNLAVALEGADHMVFSGSCGAMPFFEMIGYEAYCADPVWDVEHAHDVIAHFTTAFLLATLNGNEGATRALPTQALTFINSR